MCGWLAIVAVAAFPTVEAIRIVIERSHVVMYGDQALLELGARRAAHLELLVGPYSRDGFHHPGPALLYLLAPFVRAFEPSGPGLYLGAVVINGASLTATVAVIWRRLGRVSALWSAGTVGAFCLCLGVGTLREPWNPYLVIAPMVLFAVLWAAAMVGSGTAAMWDLVVASYLVQTHVATAPVVGFSLAALAVRWLLVGHSSTPDDRRRSWASPVGAAALGLIWVPSVVELWRDHPNNARLLWDFFTSPHATPGIAQASTSAADAMTILPFGNHDYVAALHRSPFELTVGGVLLIVGLGVAIRIARRRHQVMSQALAASAVIGMVIGPLSLMRADLPLYPYLAAWLAYVPVSVVLALGAAMFGPAGTSPGAATGREGAGRAEVGAAASGIRRWAPATVGVVAFVIAALTVASDVRTRPINRTTGSGPWPASNAATPQGKELTVRNTALLSRAAERVLAPTDRLVSITIASDGVWPYAAGIVLDLDEHGVQAVVAPSEWVLYFGHERAPDRRVSVNFTLSGSVHGVAGSRVIADLQGVALSYQRHS